MSVNTDPQTLTLQAESLIARSGLRLARTRCLRAGDLDLSWEVFLARDTQPGEPWSASLYTTWCSTENTYLGSQPTVLGAVTATLARIAKIQEELRGEPAGERRDQLTQILRDWERFSQTFLAIPPPPPVGTDPFREALASGVTLQCFYLASAAKTYSAFLAARKIKHQILSRGQEWLVVTPRLTPDAAVRLCALAQAERLKVLEARALAGETLSPDEDQEFGSLASAAYSGEGY